MHEHQALPYLRETLLFLALSGVLIPLLQRWRINQVLGFLAAGALVGPFGLGLWISEAPWLAYLTFPSGKGMTALGELGVLFLMFMIGLELSAARLWELRRWVFGAGAAQVVVSAMLIGGLTWLAGNSVESAMVLGLVLALSSTAVAVQLMSERRMLGTPLGEAAFSVLMLQDLAVVPVLLLIGLLSGASDGNLWLALGFTVLKSAGTIVMIFLLGRRVIAPLFQQFAAQLRPEIFMALTLLITLGIAGLTEMAGLSMALGAFLAGLLLAETEFQHEVEVAIEPFKGLLMGLFFMSVGMMIDVREVAGAPLWLLLAVLGLFLIKSAVVAVIFRIGGLRWERAIEGAALLGQGGEFAFVVVGYALQTRLLEPAAGQFVMLVVSLSLFATPFAARLAHLLARRLERRRPQSEHSVEKTPPDPLSGHVIIAGFGRVGQLIAQLLMANGIRYVALETNAGLTARLRREGLPVYYGDAARVELLHKVHGDQAAAIVVTMDHPAAALYAVRAIRRAYPNASICARARDENHALAMKDAGASLVIPETLETGLQLSAFVLQALGIRESDTGRLVQRERERRIAGL